MNNSRGFTLLEVLISTVLVAAVVVIVIAAIDLARTGQSRASHREQLLQIERSLYRNLVMPLRGIYPYYRRDEKGVPVLRFSGEVNSLAFVTTYTEPWREDLPNTPGLKWMRFYLDGDELKVKENLFFLEAPEEDAKERTLYRGVEELRFQYLDPEDDTWTDSWPEDRGSLPRAVKVNLRFRFNGRSIEMPPVVVFIRTSRSG